MTSRAFIHQQIGVDAIVIADADYRVKVEGPDLVPFCLEYTFGGKRWRPEGVGEIYFLSCFGLVVVPLTVPEERDYREFRGVVRDEIQHFSR